eukprot:356953_1
MESLTDNPTNSHSISVLTFNILAPCWKRCDDEGSREEHFTDIWRQRQLECIKLICNESPDIICIQEFWFKQPFIELYRSALSGYEFRACQRTGHKPDGVCIMVRKSSLEVVESREILFRGHGDRCAVLTRIRLRDKKDSDFLLANTHLTFPEGTFDHIRRKKQIQLLTDHISNFISERRLKAISVIMCGDFNGSPGGAVYDIVKSAGYESSYLACNGVEAGVTHRNHNGGEVGVDFIFFQHIKCVPPSSSNSSKRPESAQNEERQPPTEPNMSPAASDTSQDCSFRMNRSASEILRRLPRSDSASIHSPSYEHKSRPAFDRSQSFMSAENCLAVHSKSSQRDTPNVPSSTTFVTDFPYYRPVSSDVLPRNIDSQKWTTEFSISDHRPVLSIFNLEAGFKI